MTDNSLRVENFKKGLIAFGHLLDLQGANRAEVLTYYKEAFPLPEAHLDYGFIALESKLESVALDNFRIAVEGGMTDCVDQLVLILEDLNQDKNELEKYRELAKKLDAENDFRYLRSKFFTHEDRGEIAQAFAIFERIFKGNATLGNYLLTYLLSFPETLDIFGQFLVNGGYITEFELEDPELIQAKMLEAMDESIKTSNPYPLRAKFRYLASQGLWSDAQAIAAKGLEIDDPDLVLLYAIAWQNAGYTDEHPLHQEFLSKYNIVSLLRLDSATLFDDDFLLDGDISFQNSQPRLGMEEFDRELKRDGINNIPDALSGLISINEISEEFFISFEEALTTGKNYKNTVANLVNFARTMDINLTFALDKVSAILKESIAKNKANALFLSFLIRSIQEYEDLVNLNFILIQSTNISEDSKIRIYQSHSLMKCLLSFDSSHCILKDSLHLGFVPTDLVSFQLSEENWRLDVEHRELLDSYYKSLTQ